jgi:hypothetical protein
MNELSFLGSKWKGVYTVEWCHLCRTAIIICPKCKNSSCNGSGCAECIEDQSEFAKTKTRVEEYLSPEEILVYQKAEKLKDFILISIQNGETEIDFKKLYEEGKFSVETKRLFEKELKNI